MNSRNPAQPINTPVTESNLIPTKGLVEFTGHTGSPIRANAGAGTGKTTAIKERVAKLIENAVPPRSILLMTFSRKAAESLRHRIRKKTGALSADITIGTFHSIAATEIRNLQGKKIHILDANDAGDYWEQAFAEIVSDAPSRFVEEFDEYREILGIKTRAGKKSAPREHWKKTLAKIAGWLRDIRSEQVNQNLHGQDFAGYAVPILVEELSVIRKISEIFDMKAWATAGLTNYERLKAEQNALDYDDTLARWAGLLHNNREYHEAVKARWQHVLIDEYQDTNYLQEHIIQGLNTDNLTVVGDPSQCIYAFRKAVPKLMVEFHKRYPRVKEIALEDNFRSKDEILDVANQVLAIHDDLIRGNEKNPMSRLKLRGTKGNGGCAALITNWDQNDEAEYLHQRIRALISARVPPTEIVVLARTSFYNAALEVLLRTDDIPVQVWGGHSLMECKTMKDLVALLKIGLRPSQPNNFLRVAKYVIGGERRGEEMFLRWKMGAKPLPGSEGFIRVIDNLVSMHAAEKTDPAVSNIQRSTDLAIDTLRYLYNPENPDKLPHKETKELEAIGNALKQIIDNLHEAKGTEGVDGTPHLEELVSQLSLDPLSNQGDGDCVTLSTIHQAKGLEWDHVFIAGCHEGRLTFFKNGWDTTQEEAEEECRLLYVAITRAKEILTMTNVGEPIRFLRSATCQPHEHTANPGRAEPCAAL